MRHTLAAALAMVAGPVWAADLTSPSDRQALISPTAPLGVASEFPKSPLTESFVEGSARFPDERQAKAACPSDVVVWIENGSKIYQLVRYARAQTSGLGSYMCQADALSEGDFPDNSNRSQP